MNQYSLSSCPKALIGILSILVASISFQVGAPVAEARCAPGRFVSTTNATKFHEYPWQNSTGSDDTCKTNDNKYTFRVTTHTSAWVRQEFQNNAGAWSNDTYTFSTQGTSGWIEVQDNNGNAPVRWCGSAGCSSWYENYDF